MGMRPRTVGLSRNQNVPPILSTVNGRKVNKASPQRTVVASAAATSVGARTSVGQEKGKDIATGTQPSKVDGVANCLNDRSVGRRHGTEMQITGQLISSFDDHDSLEEEPEKSTLARRGADKAGNTTSLEHGCREMGSTTPPARSTAVFNPPPASSDTEEFDVVEDLLLTRNKPSGANLLADSDSDDDRPRRGDLRPTTFSSQISSATRTAKAAKKEPVRSSQTSGLSQPTSSAGSHLENALGHVRKHKAKQTYRKPKPQPAGRKKGLEKLDIPDSPVKLRAAFKPPEDSDDSLSPNRPKATLKLGSDLESDPDLPTKVPRKSTRKRKERISTNAKNREEKKFKPTFYVPEGSPDREIDRDRPQQVLRKLSSSSLSDVDLSDDEAKTRATPSEALTTCPWCGKPVRPEALKEFSRGRRLNVSMQTRFCRSHQKQSARDDWREKGYPNIDWEALPGRLALHHDYLLSIVNGQSSHFRDALARDVRQGKSRTLKQEENLNPGYYGPRGFNLMCDFLGAQFGGLLKERAVSDRVIAGRGSAAFVQTVLVAELAVELIKEDMAIGDVEARKVFQESKELGEFVHEEA